MEGRARVFPYLPVYLPPFELLNGMKYTPFTAAGLQLTGFCMNDIKILGG